MAVAHAVAFIDEIQMRVDLHKVERLLPVEGVDAGDIHRMVAADHHRHRAGGEDGAHPGLDIRVALHRVGMHDVGIADIDDPHLVILQIGDVVLMVVGAGMAEGEQGRCLAHAPRPEARAGAELRAEIKRRAEDGEVGVDRIPVRLVGIFAEAAQPHKGKVQPSALIAMSAHLVHPLPRVVCVM